MRTKLGVAENKIVMRISRVSKHNAVIQARVFTSRTQCSLFRFEKQRIIPELFHLSSALSLSVVKNKPLERSFFFFKSLLFEREKNLRLKTPFGLFDVDDTKNFENMYAQTKTEYNRR